MMGVTEMTDYGPTAVYECCRLWTVYTLWPIGRCGGCGQRPEWKAAEEASPVADAFDRQFTAWMEWR